MKSSLHPNQRIPQEEERYMRMLKENSASKANDAVGRQKKIGFISCKKKGCEKVRGDLLFWKGPFGICFLSVSLTLIGADGVYTQVRIRCTVLFQSVCNVTNGKTVKLAWRRGPKTENWGETDEVFSA